MLHFYSLPVAWLDFKALPTANDIIFQCQKRVGALNMVQLLEGLEAVSILPFTKILGWSVEAVHAFLVDVRLDLKKKSVHLLHDL